MQANSTNLTNGTAVKPVHHLVVGPIPWEIFAMIVVILSAAFGGFLVSLLAGFHMKRIGPIPEIHLKPVLTKFKIP